MTRGHKHTWKRAPDWDRPELLREGIVAVECFPCRRAGFVKAGWENDPKPQMPGPAPR